jgi:hypothetical protein
MLRNGNHRLDALWWVCSCNDCVMIDRRVIVHEQQEKTKQRTKVYRAASPTTTKSTYSLLVRAAHFCEVPGGTTRHVSVFPYNECVKRELQSWGEKWISKQDLGKTTANTSTGSN